MGFEMFAVLTRLALLSSVLGWISDHGWHGGERYNLVYKEENDIFENMVVREAVVVDLGASADSGQWTVTNTNGI
jgi:hypothetical protein